MLLRLIIVRFPRPLPRLILPLVGELEDVPTSSVKFDNCANKLLLIVLLLAELLAVASLLSPAKLTNSISLNSLNPSLIFGSLRALFEPSRALYLVIIIL